LAGVFFSHTDSHPLGDAVMSADPSLFAELMLDAQRATVALDGATDRGDLEAKASAVKEGNRVYTKLLGYQRATWMTTSQAAVLQTALDLLQARLRSFGQAA
jgi:hypothetical protein